MPLRLTDIQKTERAVTFTYAGEDVTVVYLPGLFTPVRRMQMVVGSQSYWDTDGTPKVSVLHSALREYHRDLAALLVRWDVLGEDGAPLGPSAELLAQFPQAFINALLDALIKDQAVDPQTGKASDATSAAKGS